MKPTVSVVVCVRNVEKYIDDCLRSLLCQTLNEFEVIIVDDMSNDNTRNMIEKSNDERVKYFRNKRWLGIAKSRNIGLKHARGEHIFFTDGDCTVSKDWIAEGIRYLNDPECVGVEGKTYYVCEEYKPTRADAVMDNKEGGQFNTCNMAYKRSLLEIIGGFDERYIYLDDRDLALRAIRRGTIRFNRNMVVYHRKVTFKPAQFVKTGKRIRDRVLLYKKFNDRSFFIWRIAYPVNLISVIFPPLVLGSFFRTKYRTKEDFNLFPFNYFRLVYERLSLWEMCAKERVFLI